MKQSKPKALFVLGTAAYERIYGPAERATIADLVTCDQPPCTAEQLAEDPGRLSGVEVIFSGWGAPRMDAAFLAHAPCLRAVFYGAGSVKGFVSDAFWDRGIVLASSWGANAIPVAEYTQAQIVLSLKRAWTMAYNGRVRHAWPAAIPVPGVYGSTVGLVSLGMIGRLVAQRLQSHDLRVLACDPFVTQAQADAAGLGVRMVPLTELFAESDVVSLHTPSLPETRGLINATLLASLKPGATLINTARGAVIDEPALVALLQCRADLTAILDVTDPEPPRPDSPLYTLPNVFLTPHIAGSVENECRRMGHYAAEECRRWLAGEPLRWQITRETAARLA